MHDVRSYRVALYSHDAMGIGHLRRNLRIARALAEDGAAVLLLAGLCEARSFEMPPGVDCVTLPALKKVCDGAYEPRRLAVSEQQLVAMRSAAIRAAVDAFAPDLFVVDKLPRGVVGELVGVLEELKRRRPRAGGRTRCVLGLRDVLDAPDATRREWNAARNDLAVDEYYDAVWIYGDPAVFDAVREYRFGPAVVRKARYTGYLDGGPAFVADCEENRSRECDPLASLGLPPGRLALCMVGGGEDGAPLADAFANARLPADTSAIILTGPFMPMEARRRLQDCIADDPRRRLLVFSPHPHELLHRADRVVTMGGYNSICEVLTSGKRALVVPRVHPRREQLARAERLRDLGLIDLLHPSQLTPDAIANWLSRPLDERGPAVCHIDFSGLARIPALARELRERRDASPVECRADLPAEPWMQPVTEEPIHVT
jgi:predicted glycosyltransferase